METENIDLVKELVRTAVRKYLKEAAKEIWAICLGQATVSCDLVTKEFGDVELTLSLDEGVAEAAQELGQELGFSFGNATRRFRISVTEYE